MEKNNENILPDFCMITDNGLELFSGYYITNKKNGIYTLSNGDSEISLPRETVYEIKAHEFNSININDKEYNNILESQYNDFFKYRKPNNAENFIHNYSVICRTQVNTPVEAIKAAKDLINMLPENEKKLVHTILNNKKESNQNINDVVMDLYFSAIKQKPLNDNYIKDVNSKNYIPVKASDYISETGSNIESSLNIKIGDKINNVPIKLWKIENNEKSKKKEIQYKDLIINIKISSKK